MGLGIEPSGASFVGSTSDTDTGYGLCDFSFSAQAVYGERSVRVSLYAPKPGSVSNWSRRLRILRKQDEWSRGHFDADSRLVADVVQDLEGEVSFVDSDLSPGHEYYYSLYEMRSDGVWVHDLSKGRRTAYAYGHWGLGDYLYQSLPHGWRTADAEVGCDLRAFIRMLSLPFEGLKTDAESLLNLFSANDIHEDLIPLLDERLGWPTWGSAPGLKKRKATLDAVAWYKIKGRKASYEQVIEEIFDWALVLLEGWRYVMFSNGEFGSTTPDLSPGNVPKIWANKGLKTDLLKYTNDSIGWHGVTGLGILLTEIPGVSTSVLSDSKDRAVQVLDWGKASFVNYEFSVLPGIVEEVAPGYLDFWSPEMDTWCEPSGRSGDETETPQTWDCALFISNSLNSITVSTASRTFNKEVRYEN